MSDVNAIREYTRYVSTQTQHTPNITTRNRNDDEIPDEYADISDERYQIPLTNDSTD